MKFSVFQVSRRGARQNNQDRMGYCYTSKSGIFMLTDGMGGHPMGEVAAQLALQVISAMFQKQAQPVLRDMAAFLPDALLAAHRQILRYSVEKGLPDTPRTTLVAAVVQDGGVSWIHCGDSRLYLVRNGALLARTRDHSYLEQQNAATHGGQIPKVNRNALYTCLGSPARPVFDVTGPLALQQGDRLMLCSDGLWGPLSDDDIVFELSRKPVSESVPLMVEAALRKAGHSSDNVTAIALEWETPDGFESTRGGVCTDTISAGVFASTVQATLLGATPDDPDDAAPQTPNATGRHARRRPGADKG